MFLRVPPTLCEYFARNPDTEISDFASRFFLLNLQSFTIFSKKPNLMYFSFSLWESTIAVVGLKIDLVTGGGVGIWNVSVSLHKAPQSLKCHFDTGQFNLCPMTYWYCRVCPMELFVISQMFQVLKGILMQFWTDLEAHSTARGESVNLSTNRKTFLQVMKHSFEFWTTLKTCFETLTPLLSKSWNSCMIFIAAGFKVSIWFSVLVRIRPTEEELSDVYETLANKDSCITTSITIQKVIQSILDISMPLCPRRLSLMLTQYLSCLLNSAK